MAAPRAEHAPFYRQQAEGPDWLPFPIAGILLLSVVTFPLSLRLARSVSTAERDRALFADRALRARADEHRRIAEVLHERTVQDLAAARLILDAAKQTSDPVAVRAALDQTTDLLAAEVAELRGLLSGGEATEWQADALGEALSGWIATLPHPERIVLTLPEQPLPLARAEVAMALRAIKEGIRNAVKHAGETLVRVLVQVADGELRVEVADQGAGLTETGTPGLGLRIVHYGAASLGGEVSVHGEPGEGTTLRVRLPYPHA